MNIYDHRCADCQVCPNCGRSAWCEGDHILVIPCPHKGYCGDCNLDECAECRIAEGLESVYHDPFDQGGDDPDPWGPLAAEARADTDRFWSTVGDRSFRTRKDPT